MAGLQDWINPDSVRRAIDQEFTEKELSNSSITDPIFTSPVFLELLRIDPQAETREGTAQAYVKNALNLFLAARILPTIRFTEKEDFGDGGGFTLQKVNVEKRVAELRQQAVEQLDVIINVQPATQRPVPPAFIVVTG